MLKWKEKKKSSRNNCLNQFSFIGGGGGGVLWFVEEGGLDCHQLLPVADKTTMFLMLYLGGNLIKELIHVGILIIKNLKN